MSKNVNFMIIYGTVLISLIAVAKVDIYYDICS